MKIISFFKRIKNGTLKERINEIKTERLAKNYKRQAKLQEKYKLYQILNVNNRYNTEYYLAYYYLRDKYAYVLNEPVKVTAPQEKSDKIWICWFQGLNNAPDVVKACVNSIKKRFPDKDVTIVTDDNIDDYIDIPEYISQKVGEGISYTHFSDIIRAMLLNKYGGLWVDATTFCTSADFYKEIEDLPLFVYQNVDMTRRDFSPIVAESWLIYAKSNQKILLLTQKLLFEYWKNESKLINYFLFHMFFALAAAKFAEDWKKIPVFSEVPPNVMGFELGDKFNETRWRQLLKMSDFHKLSYKWPHGDENDKETLYNYILAQKD